MSLQAWLVFFSKTEFGVGNSMKMLFSRKEAAATLSVSLRTVDNLIGKKQLVARRVGRRVLVPLQSLEQFIRRDHISPISEVSE